LTKYKNVEYISYAIRTVSTKTINYTHNQEKIDGLSLLLDYEDDFKLFQIIYSSIGPTADLKKVINFFNHNKELVDINKSPLVTIYTCAYNSAEYINKAFESVVHQSIFNKCEYILIDDYSNDLTLEEIAKTSLKCGHKDKISYFRNNRNLGLSSSSNIALSKAKGKYIIRIDSDDFFAYETALAEMVEYAEFRNSEILYPNNYFGSLDIIQSGNVHNHVGGALFNKNALNFIKFTDGLRGYEGYDLFLRAKDRLKIHYFKKPAFFYTQRDGSLSKQDPAVRNKIKSEIKARLEVIK
jgi:glycosyltransferase involved in cell wall biosynthesis